MPVTLREYSQARVFSVKGELSADNAAALQQFADEQAGADYSDLIIDLHGCSYINSVGLETLINIKRQCDNRLGRLRLIGLNERCQIILRITRLHRLFVWEEDLPTALANME
jgi:anti-anti-sigma factor